MNWILPLSLLIIFECIADIFAKDWSLKGGSLLAFLALASYVIANTFWLFALKNGSGLGKGAIIFSIVTAVVAIIIGIFFYKEDVSRLQMIGIFLGLISLVFIFLE